jgi:NitT/TauT family transport system substrate-binding protein
MVLYLKTGKEFQYVLALDDSAGGDGIVARKEIKSITDLRGKKVAMNEGSVSQFFLNVLLKEAGLSQKDLNVVNMKQGDAGAAFVAEKVDAAVTWEPWLSKGKAAPHGHILVDSSKTPGLITDVLIFRRDVIEKRPREIQGIVNAWNKAVAYWEKNQTEANEIMAKGVGDWLKDPKVFAEVLTGVKFYNRDANVKFFGTAQKPGDLYKVVQNALDVWGSFGRLQAKMTPKDLVNHAFVK